MEIDSIVRARSTGGWEHSAPVRRLRAGPVTVEYANGAIRYLALDGDEVVRRIYFALRDQDWNTIEGRISDERVDAADDKFSITFVSLHERGPIRFSWTGRIRGEHNGEISFAIEGETLSRFKRNRIGLCVLHPMSVAGQRCTVTHPDGRSEVSSFPRLISPHQPFMEIGSLEYSTARGASVAVEFEGDLFEMEDQRNWTDASFKTYSTPLALPFPVELEAGARIGQSVTVRPVASRAFKPESRGRRTRDGEIEIRARREGSFKLPELGFAWDKSATELGAGGLNRIRALRADHLRVDLHPEIDSVDGMKALLRGAMVVGAPLEAALFMGGEEQRSLQRCMAAIEATRPAIKRFLVFREGVKSTPAASVRSAREHLRGLCPGSTFCGGTDAFFAELNRERPDASVVDGVTFSINPQVHVFDNASLIESLAAQRATIETAKSFSASKPVHVSPVTFKMRWNPNATTMEEVSAEEAVLARIDLRQLSLFGAAWTAGSIHHLGAGGAASITYFEAAGPRGLLDDGSAELESSRFPCVPGGVFPLYCLFLELAAYRGGKGFEMESEEPLSVEAFAAEQGGRTLFIVSNYTDRPVVGALGDVEGSAQVRTLDIETYEKKCESPEAYLEESRNLSSDGTGFRVALPPSGVAFVAI